MKRILILDRSSSKAFSGGDTVQIGYIYKFLCDMGYVVDRYSNLAEIDLLKYDLGFVFNLTNRNEAYLHAQFFKNHKTPYILFPVYWDFDFFQDIGPWNLKKTIKKLIPKSILELRSTFKYASSNYSQLKLAKIKILDILSVRNKENFILENAHFICPNSNAEKDHILRKFSQLKIDSKMNVIFNCINIDEIKNSILEEIELELPENFICCIGGIGPRKNQLNLVRAMDGLDVDLLIIGKPSIGCEKYYDKVKAVANKRVHFLEAIPRKNVFKILKRAIGHIQPSYIETPGLVSLEAAICGCNVGVGLSAPVQEYFEEFVEYCNPHSIEAIRGLLERLLCSRNNDDLCRHVESKFNCHVVLNPLISLIENI